MSDGDDQEHYQDGQAPWPPRENLPSTFDYEFVLEMVIALLLVVILGLCALLWVVALSR